MILEEDILSNPNRKTEMVKIMIQTLENLGYEYFAPIFFLILLLVYRKAARNLVKESGIDLESENLRKFKVEIKKGDWDKVRIN